MALFSLACSTSLGGSFSQYSAMWMLSGSRSISSTSSVSLPPHRMMDGDGGFVHRAAAHTLAQGAYRPADLGTHADVKITLDGIFYLDEFNHVRPAQLL